jgi:hydrogenase maturation protease
VSGQPSALVIGVGNRYRGDDGAGLEVARRIREASLPRVAVEEFEGEPVSLVDVWEGAEDVYVVDAVASGGEAGTIHRFDAIAEPPPVAFRSRGTHAFSLSDAVELARALGRLPERLVVYGIEGETFLAGTVMSPRVEAAVARLADRMVAELAER